MNKYDELLNIYNELCNTYKGEIIGRDNLSYKGISGLSEEILDTLDSSYKIEFGQKLFDYLEKLKISQSEAARRSCVSRQTMSKLIRSQTAPSRATIYAIIIGLELNIDEAKELLEYAGYTFRTNKKEDLIVMAAIMSKYKYNVLDVNRILYDNDFDFLLGEVPREDPSEKNNSEDTMHMLDLEKQAFIDGIADLKVRDDLPSFYGDIKLNGIIAQIVEETMLNALIELDYSQEEIDRIFDRYLEIELKNA